MVNAQLVAGSLTWNSDGSLGLLAISDTFNTANSQTCTYGNDDLGRIANTTCLPVGSQTPIWLRPLHTIRSGISARTRLLAFPLPPSIPLPQINSREPTTRTVISPQIACTSIPGMRNSNLFWSMGSQKPLTLWPCGGAIERRHVYEYSMRRGEIKSPWSA